MKIVDLRKRHAGVNPKYMDVPQPMYVFHSKRELAEYIKNKRIKSFRVIKDLQGFLDFVKTYNLQGKNKLAQVTEINVFVRTEDKFIPETVASKGATRGTIMWKLDSQNKPIPTDGCYIQLHLIFSARNHYLCYFSNGIETLSLSKWNLTAAIKDQFSRPVDGIGGTKERSTYDKRFEELIKRKKITVRDVRLFHILFNPLSDVYLNIDGAVQKIFGRTIRKADREKIVQTERFRKVFFKELGALMSDLQAAFKSQIPDKEMVDMAKKIFDKSIGDGTVDDALKVYDAILNIRESEQGVPATNVPMIEGKEKPAITMPKKDGEDSVELELYDEETTTITPPPETEEKKPETIEDLKETTGAIDYDGMSKLTEQNTPGIDDL